MLSSLVTSLVCWSLASAPVLGVLFDASGKKSCPSRGKTPEYSFEEVKKSLLIKLATVKMDHIDDMIQSVKKMELFDIDGEEPTLQLVTDPNVPDRDVRNQEMRADYTVDRKEWRARKIAFENNK